MKSNTQLLLNIMHVLSWITFIGLMIKGGALLLSYGVSVVNPEGAKNLYDGLNLYALRQTNFWQYTASVSFIVALVLSEAYIAFLVIRVLSRMKLANPFTKEISALLEQISHFILGTWIVAVLFNAHTKWLMKRMDGLEQNLVPLEFIFLAGVIFVMAQIFKKGVEIQSENELTV